MSKAYPIFGTNHELMVYDPDELIDLFLKSTADGIAMLDMENRFIRVNQMYTKIFGFTEEDIIGRNVEELVIPSFVLDIISEVQKGKTYTNMITQRIHKDGSIIDIAVSYSPFRNPDGDIIAVLAIFRDFSELKNMERELKRTRKLYKLIAENTSDMIKLYSTEKEVLYASPSHQKVLGIPPEELVGRNVYDIIQPDEIENFERVFNSLKQTQEPQLFRAKLKNGISTETNISPVFNDKGEVESYVTVGRNISDRLENEEALRNLDRLSIIGQLAAGVAHEIRNPLTSLKGFSKLLKISDDKEKQEHYLSIIMGELDRIDIIVNEFMSLAKPQAIQFEQENLLTILESTVNVLHPQAILHNVQFTTHYSPGVIELLCSPNQLKQVFVNFLKNAIEAMPHGGEVQIHVEKLKNNKVVIAFSDEGLGIDTELLKFLGTPFYTTKDKGIGLGLTVSNKIIQEHNGTMKIESQPGKGTTVKVELTYL